MKTAVATKVSENKIIIISVLVSVSGLLMRSCQAEMNAFGLPMCGEEASAFIGVNAAHAHCMGCYVAAAGLVAAFASVFMRQLWAKRLPLE